MSYSPNFRGRVALGTVVSLESSFLNLSGGILYQYTAVSIDSNGNATPTDVASESLSFSTIGVIKTAAINGQVGTAVTSGRLQNVTTTFAFGDAIYVDKITGALTNIKPSIGVSSFVAGDWIVQIGTVLKNEANPLNKDYYINPTVVGQL